MLRLEFERRKRGWTQTELAYQASMTAADISRYEKGRMKPYDSHILRLSMVFDITPNKLMEEVKG